MKTACVALILALIAAPAAAIEKDIPGTVHDTETNRPCALRTKSVKLCTTASQVPTLSVMSMLTTRSSACSITTRLTAPAR